MTDGIMAYLQRDHERIEALLADYLAARRTDPARARRCFETFAALLRWHMMWEEEVIFPYYERKGGDRMLTSMLRADHNLILWQLRLVERQIAEVGAAAADEGALFDQLASHAAREDETFYHLLDQMLSANEIDRIFAAHPSVPQATAV